MNFCRNCGASLSTSGRTPGAKLADGAPMPSAADVVQRRTPPSGRDSAVRPGPAKPSQVECAKCGRTTPAGMSFCQHCGAKLGPQDTTIDPQRRPRPLAGTRPPGVPGSRPSAVSRIASAGPMMDGEAVAETLAASGDAASELIGTANRLAQVAEETASSGRGLLPDPAVLNTLPETPIDKLSRGAGGVVRSPVPGALGRSASGRGSSVQADAAVSSAWGVLVSVQQDGSDGASFPLRDDVIDIGREVGLAFADDRFLAPHHARLSRTPEGVMLEALDRTNGVFRRLEEETDLEHGDSILCGRQLLRFDEVDQDERRSAALVQYGVVCFGSPSGEPWGRLLQLLASGGVRDIRHLQGPEVVLGREEGELVFRTDEFLSRRHCAFRHRDGASTLVDLGSSNGTYVKLRSSVIVGGVEHVRMGNQLFRLELE